jgi:hypothetical protein
LHDLSLIGILGHPTGGNKNQYSEQY